MVMHPTVSESIVYAKSGVHAKQSRSHVTQGIQMSQESHEAREVLEEVAITIASDTSSTSSAFQHGSSIPIASTAAASTSTFGKNTIQEDDTSTLIDYLYKSAISCLSLHRINTIAPPMWWSFIGCNYLLLMYALFSSIMIYRLATRVWDALTQETPTFNAFHIAFLLFFMSSHIASWFDARSRFQTYKLGKDILFTKDTIDDRRFWIFVVSMCQRNALFQAAREVGTIQPNKYTLLCEYIASKGYRWYHVLPDFVITHPLFFLSRKFWKFTFFNSYYEPKVDYEEILQLSLTSPELLPNGSDHLQFIYEEYTGA